MKIVSGNQGSRFSRSRRDFITGSVAAIATTSVAASPLNIFFKHHSDRIRAVAFDAFPIFDPRSVIDLAERMFPEKGKELNDVWRTKQFEYCWLRSSAKQYSDFWAVTEDALVFAAKKTGVNLSTGNRKELMNHYLKLGLWPDVLPALEEFKKKGITLSFLSNMTDEMLISCLRYSKTEKYFEHIISTDRVKSYKPHPKAYQLGIDILKLKKEEILFVAFAGWDASGSKWFGYPTFWINRLGSPNEELDTKPDGTGNGMNELLDFIS